MTRRILAATWLIAALALAAATHRLYQLTEAFRAPITQSTSAN